MNRSHCDCAENFRPPANVEKSRRVSLLAKHRDVTNNWRYITDCLVYTSIVSLLIKVVKAKIGYSIKLYYPLVN